MPETIKTKPSEIPQPKAPSVEALAINFSVDQLPPMDSSEGGQVTGDNGSGVIDTSKTNNNAEKQFSTETPKEVKTEVAPKTETTTTEVKPDETQATDGVKSDKQDETLPSFLKPPKGKADDVKKEVKSELGSEKIGSQLKSNDFDYTGFSAGEVTHLKNMNIPARKFVGELIKQNRDLSKVKDGTYLQHPQAHILSPDYQKMLFDYNAANTESSWWEKQLLACKAGKPVVDIKGIDEKTGQIVAGNQYEASDALEEQIRLKMQNAQRYASDSAKNIGEFPTRFKGMVENDMKAIEEECHKKFAWVANPKVADYTMSITMPDGKVVDKSLKQIGEDYLSLYPSYMRNHPMAKPSANLMVAVALLGEENKQLKAQLAANSIKVGERANAEPSGGGKLPPKPKVNGVSEFSLAGSGLEL